MTTYNTGNQIGSNDARDLSDNAENLDQAVNSLSQTFVDRLGVTRDTLEGVYQKSAYYRAGTFDDGYTLTNNRQTLAYGNVEYSWSGAFPKVVSAGSTPATSGGIGAGAWVDRTQETLKDELRSESGLKLIGGYSSYAALQASTGLSVGEKVKLISWNDGWAVANEVPTGGGEFVVTSGTSAADNGGSICVNADGKRLVRVIPQGWVGWSPKEFGAKGGSISGEQAKLQNWITSNRCILDAVYKIESTLTMRGGLHLVGIGHPVDCGFVGNLGTSFALSADGDKQVGYISNVGFTGMTSGGLINLSNGAHMWRLDRLLFRNCIGPRIILNSVWDSEFYNIHSIGGGSSTGSAVDQAAIVSKGDSNNNFIYGLRIEQPLNCGIHVAAGSDLRIIGGKIDCGFTANQPTNGGCEVYGTLRLHSFLFAGFTTNKLKVYGQGTVLSENVTYGGGGGAAHVYWRPTYVRTGSTAQSFRPLTGSITIIGGSLEKVHSSVTTVVPHAFDIKGDYVNYRVRETTIASVASPTSVFLTTGTYSANDTDNKYYIAKKSSPRSVISKINTTYSTQQVDTTEAHGLSAGDTVIIVSSASEHNRLTIDQSCLVKVNLFQEVAVKSTAAPLVSNGATTVYSDYNSTTYGDASGRYAVLENGDAYLLAPSFSGNLVIVGDVAAQFASGTSFYVASGAMLDTLQSQRRLFWYNNGGQKTVMSKTIELKGRNGVHEIFPWKD